MSGDPEYTPAPTPRVSVPVPTVRPESTRHVEPADAAPPTPPDDTVPAGYGPPSSGGTGRGTAVAITILSLVLIVITAIGILGSALSAIGGSGPLSEAQDGWTPAREQYLDFPILGSPVVTFVAIAGAIFTRRSRGWWALWLVGGGVLVVLFIVIGVVAMRGAPPWE